MRGKCSMPVLAVQVVVAAAVALQLGAALLRPVATQVPNLDAAVPAQLDGWKVEAESLGSTPESAAWVAQTLNFDRAAQRTYSREDERFTVFAAYWSRGRMPARAVSIHTPDCCWTQAGYTCSEMKFRQALSVPGTRLQPAEWRVFRAPDGETIHTVFWQIVAGKAFDFGGEFNGAGNLRVGFRTFVADALMGCREQLFVTVASSVPIERLERERGFQTVMRRLAEAGLRSQ